MGLRLVTADDLSDLILGHGGRFCVCGRAHADGGLRRHRQDGARALGDVRHAAVHRAVLGRGVQIVDRDLAPEGGAGVSVRAGGVVGGVGRIFLHAALFHVAFELEDVAGDLGNALVTLPFLR